MIYKDYSYEELVILGTILKSPYIAEHRSIKHPILFDGNVYKFFPRKNKNCEKILLLLEKLELKYLSKINGFIGSNDRCGGYFYQYDASPLLKDELENISQNQRLIFIMELIYTHHFLKERGLIYFDYHTANVLVNTSIRLIDVDSIVPKYQVRELEIDYYLFELLISIYLKYDLTFNKDNSNLYSLFASFFEMPEIIRGENLNFLELFDAMVKKNHDFKNLREDVKIRI